MKLQGQHIRTWALKIYDTKKVCLISIWAMPWSFNMHRQWGSRPQNKNRRALPSPWQPLDKLFAPGSRPHTTKILRGHTGYELKKKDELSTRC
jgi:hypothetical protein